jgi:hypothetical protein
MEESPEELQQSLDRFRADAMYAEEHREELLRKYPERWIAIYMRKVVATAENPDELFRKVEQKGIRPGKVVHRYMTEKGQPLIVYYDAENNLLII